MEGLNQRIVGYGIERQNTEHVRPLVQEYSTDLGRYAAKCVVGITAIGHQLSHQAGIGRIPIPLAVNVVTLGSNVAQVKGSVGQEFTLDAEAPVVAHAVTKVGVEEDRREVGSIRNGRGRRGVRHRGRKETAAGEKEIGTEEVVECIERIVLEVLFKGRIAARVTEEITEYAIVKDPERASDGRLSVLPRIPRELYPCTRA